MLQARRLRVQFPIVSLEILTDIICPGRLKPVTEMSTKNISWVLKAAGAYGLQSYHSHVPTVMKSGSLNLLELSGPV
jgi:hypothetical protein